MSSPRASANRCRRQSSAETPRFAADWRERVQQRFCRGAGAVRLDTVPGAGARGHNFCSSAGSGLGLSIVGRIAELHGGTFEIGSPAAGNGALVRLFLPLAATAANAAGADRRRTADH